MTMQMKEVVCTNCGATNIGPQARCLRCQAVLPVEWAEPAAPPRRAQAPQRASATRAPKKQTAAQAPPKQVAAKPPQAAPRFCTQCGTPLKAGQRFCTNCGQPV